MRLVKTVLPESTHLQRDAVTALQQASVVFVNFLCAAANEEAHRGRRKNIDTKDIFGALGALEYSSFHTVLEAESRRWTENAAQKKVAVHKTKEATIKPEGESAPATKDQAEPATKKARVAEDVDGTPQLDNTEETNEELNDLDTVTEAESEADEEDEEAGASTSPEEDEDEDEIPEELDVLEQINASLREDDDTLDDGDASD